jgi:hypothetical protein
MAFTGLQSDNTLYTGYTDATIDPKHGQRRKHNFGDRVYKLTPEETPFFAYLSAVGKVPTDDPVFRVLEDRAPTKWADRTFQIDCSSNNVTIEATEGELWDQEANTVNELTLTTASDSDELIAGMLVQALVYENVAEGAPANTEIPAQITARIESVGTGVVTLRTVYTSGDVDTTISSGNLDLQVIGTAWGEGTNAPESFGYAIEDTYGQTQIFKTSAYMSNTAMATVMRGYANEWDRIWSLKLREHKVDIERAFLFNNKGNANGISYTDGMIGNIIAQAGTWELTDTNALAYASGKSFVRGVDISGTSEATYDRFLVDFETIFAPERGGDKQKFCMASMPVVTYFNRLKSGFGDQSVSSNMHYNLNFQQLEGGLGHKVMKIDTVHGSLAMVRNPLLKGIGKSMMVGIDLDNVKYRPLVGNGLNRDTYIETNVQTAGEDSRKDLILTEAGLEVCMPESHFLYQFHNDGTPIG